MTKKFIVLKLPRTGSSMFGKVLDSHPDVTCKNEILNRVAEKSLDEKLSFLTKYFNGEKIPKAKSISGEVLGATINPFKYDMTVEDISRSINTSEFKFVVLLRENILLQARSSYIAKKVLNKFSSNLRGIQEKSKLYNIQFDFSKLEKIAKNLEVRSKQLIEFAQQISNNSYLMVYYEELLESREETFDKVFDYIGTYKPPTGFDYTAGYERVLSHDWQDICANFDEIHNYPYLSKFLDK